MKKCMVLLAILILCLGSVGALAQEGVAYGIYNQPGEHADSLIRVTITREGDAVADVQMDEKLLPASAGGAEGWAELGDEQAALLGDAVIQANGKTYPVGFALDGVTFTATADELYGVVYTGDVDGATVALMDYILTEEGGAWYFAQESASILNANGEAVAELEIGTKASIEHGVGFWPSDIKFPGNIERICAYILANGVSYDVSDITMGGDGAWAVADVTTGATLAGTTNYLLLAKEAYEKAAQ